MADFVMNPQQQGASMGGGQMGGGQMGGGQMGGGQMGGISGQAGFPTADEHASSPSSALSGIKAGFRKIGNAIDAGLSSVMRDVGQSLHANCPNCSGLMRAPPNEFVQCPHCSHQFMSPSVSTRTAEISKNLSQESKQAWKGVSADVRGGLSSPGGSTSASSPVSAPPQNYPQRTSGGL